jgi:hypothetical protein
MAEGRGAYMVVARKSEGQRPRRRARIDRMIILKWILRKLNGSAWVELSWFRVG